MKVDSQSVNFQVDVGSKSGISANIEPKTKIDVVIGKAARMDCQRAVNYIKSGKAELTPLVVRAETAAHKAEVCSETFVFEQGIASDVWEIEHNLGKYPSVSLVDSAGTQFEAAVEYIDENNVTVRMNGATTGKAYLN